MHAPTFLPLPNATRSLLFAMGPAPRDLVIHHFNTGEQAVLTPGDRPVFSSTGHVLYSAPPSYDSLWALPFSLDTFEATGERFPVREGAFYTSVSRDGALAYLEVLDTGQDQLVWRDRSGQQLGEIGQPQDIIRLPALSRDGRNVAVQGTENSNDDIWIHNVARPIKTRLTFASARDYRAHWSPGSDEILFNSFRDGPMDLFVRRADGSGAAEKLFGTPLQEHGHDWSRDGRYILFHIAGEESGRDLWYLEREPEKGWSEPKQFLKTQFEERAAVFSPDSRFLAYVSNESGRDEVYVRPFPSGGGEWQVSEQGGNQPRWSRDGKEIFYVEHDTLIAVSVNTKPTFSVGSTERLFSDRSLVSHFPIQNYDISGDGQRFVMVESLGTPQYTIRIVQNWYEEFRDRELD